MTEQEIGDQRAVAEWRAIHYHESALAAQAADQIRRMKASQ
jgi:hypothetical protein